MGLDGGTLPTRSDILRRSSWKLIQRDHSKSTRGGVVDNMCAPKEQSTAEKVELNRVTWTACALSGEPLRQPIVACRMGRIYNKEAAVEFMCGTLRFQATKEKLQENGFGHLHSLKDIFEVHLTPNPAAHSAEDAPFVCPITGVETNGVHQFMVLPACGHVFCERALDGLLAEPATAHATASATSTSSTTSASVETTAVATAVAAAPSNSNTGVCPLCAAVYLRDEVVLLNPVNDEKVDTNRKRLSGKAKASWQKKSGSTHPRKRRKLHHKKEAEQQAGADAHHKKKEDAPLPVQTVAK
eukprot:TRINITY_DN6724_c0_g1_i1.p1 TRINITY_DN6724_c0_g1~~TRINITY_DN6724_c0_g1_i1.p1  ORF type:complete len:307 (-),score=88.69 TRINITY_DN6724_c0_g1_i1:25-921(-)